MRITSQPTLYDVADGTKIITPTVTDTSGTVTYHWYKNPNRIRHTLENIFFTNLFPITEIPVITNDSINISDTDDFNTTVTRSEPENFSDDKIVLKFRITLPDVLDTINGDYVKFGLRHNSYPNFQWLDVFLTGNIAPDNKIWVGQTSAFVEQINGVASYTWLDVQMEVDPDVYCYWSITTSAGENYSGKVDVAVEGTPEFATPPVSLFMDFELEAFKTATVDNVTAENFELYQETNRIDTGITTSTLTVSSGDEGAYYCVIEDNETRMSTDLGYVYNSGTPGGLDFDANTKFGIDSLSATFSATHTDETIETEIIDFTDFDPQYESTNNTSIATTSSTIDFSTGIESGITIGSKIFTTDATGIQIDCDNMSFESDSLFYQTSGVKVLSGSKKLVTVIYDKDAGTYGSLIVKSESVSDTHAFTDVGDDKIESITKLYITSYFNGTISVVTKTSSDSIVTSYSSTNAITKDKNEMSLSFYSEDSGSAVDAFNIFDGSITLLYD